VNTTKPLWHIKYDKFNYRSIYFRNRVCYRVKLEWLLNGILASVGLYTKFN